MARQHRAELWTNGGGGGSGLSFQGTFAGSERLCTVRLQQQTCDTGAKIGPCTSLARPLTMRQTPASSSAVVAAAAAARGPAPEDDIDRASTALLK